MSKTFEQVIDELDVLVDEFTLIKRNTSHSIDQQLSADIDEFLKEKLGDPYSIEGEYVWYAMVTKYQEIFKKEYDVPRDTKSLNGFIEELKDKYK